MKHALITLLLAAALTIVAAPASQAAKSGGKTAVKQEQQETVVLRENVVVNSRHVRLGDLFSGAGDKADTVVAYAPEPGKQALLDANWLYRIARAYRLKWRPLSIQEQALVIRESVVIGREEIEDAILAALVDKGVDPDMSVELGNQMMRIHVAGSGMATVAAEDVIYDARSKRFTAVLKAPADDPRGQRIRATGRLYKSTETPVLARQMMAGDVIKKSDIEWIKVRASRLQKDTILDIGGLIGKAPRRGLRSGIPVRESEVRRPILVEKGSMVTIVLQTPTMILTAQGRALEAGSNGESIRITNTQSNQVIDAMVTGSGRVVVRLAQHVVMN